MPKWQARGRRGQYLGVSPDHSSTIGCILNLRSGFISPQYHVIYDDLFSTVPNAESGGTLEPILDGSFWRKLIDTGYESLLTDDDDDPLPDLHPDWLTDAEIRACQRDYHPARLYPSPPLLIPSPSVPPSIAGGTLGPPSPPSQQQPRPNRSASTAPEGAKPNPPPEGANDDMEIVFMDNPDAGTPDAMDDDHENKPNVDNDSHDLFGLPDPDQYVRGKRRKKLNRHLFDERLWMTYSRFQ